jgi:hypothetical protein
MAKVMKMFEGKVIGSPEMFKKLLQYYGADTSISCLISSNICPRDMYKMRDSGRMYKLVPLKD